MATKNEVPAGAIRTRAVELAVALAIVAIGLVVVYDSHRVGVEWAEDGPRSGYFPNIIGWILTAAGGWIAGETLYRWKALGGAVFVKRDELKPVLLMLLPTIVYVGLVWLIGIYVASALYIGAFMRLQGRYGWLPALAVALGVPSAIFALFELWFLVPLPKGPIERMLGF
ncbi:MAG: tripartite tricarboxylate transporter TctB family protein [Betaproteobacteria bacterium]|nr:tripartite tricarboxylate transporter TctB family protein [Betaproteobacteria bacterium]MCC7217599.1 tripartite tricarboxylate transporter TctB family protein [Burkholderiales bacterium]